MTNIFIDNMNGQVIGLGMDEEKFKMNDRFYLETGQEEIAIDNGDGTMTVAKKPVLGIFVVIDAVPVFEKKIEQSIELKEIGVKSDIRLRRERTIVFVEPSEKKIEPSTAATGHGDGMDKYLIAKRDGTPIKDDSEYVVFNMSSDPHVAQAVKIYCDSASGDPARADFAEALLNKMRVIRKKGLTK